MPKMATLVCIQCGHAFETLEKEVKRGRKFCSVACRQAGQGGEGNFNWKGGAAKKPRQYVDRFRAANPEKARAHDAVKRAIVAGRLVRQPCEVCGDTHWIHAHHDNYAKPLDVRWLCPAHHRDAHLAVRRLEEIAAEVKP